MNATSSRKEQDMKLSMAQIKVLESAKRSIDKARAYENFEEYQGATDPYCRGRGGAEYVRAHMEYYEPYRHYWEEAKEGVTLIFANSRTIKALEKAGLIEIIQDGGIYPDRIKVLNY